MKTTTAALVILCVLGAGAIGLAGQKSEAQRPGNPLNQQVKKVKAPAPEAKATTDEREIRNQVFTVSGRAVGPDGKPVSGATIFLVSTNDSPAGLLATATTDKDGQYLFKDAKLPYRVNKDKGSDILEGGSFQIFGKCVGRAFAWCGMKGLLIDPRFKEEKYKTNALIGRSSYFPGDPIKIDLEFAPPKKIEGRITDEKSEPIAGVKVRIGHCDYVNTAGKEQHPNYREFWAIYQAPSIMPEVVCAVTDAEGRFAFSSVPPEVFCWLGLEHPDYAHMALYTSTADNPPETHDENHPVLRLPLRLTLHSVRTIKVHVRSKKDDKPLAGVRVSGYQKRATGDSSYGTSDKEGNVTLKLPPGKYRLLGDPSRESDFARTYEDLTVEDAPAEQSIILRQQEGCVLILKVIDADTGKGFPKVDFWFEKEKGSRWGVQSSTVYVDNPMTNDKGELRAVVQPGEGLYGIGFGRMPDGYECENPEDFIRGRELLLPAGKTITETFKLRKKK